MMGLPFMPLPSTEDGVVRGTPVGVSGPPPPCTLLHLALRLFEMVMMMGLTPLPPDATPSIGLGLVDHSTAPTFPSPELHSNHCPGSRPHLSCPDPASCTSMGAFCSSTCWLRRGFLMDHYIWNQLDTFPYCLSICKPAITGEKRAILSYRSLYIAKDQW